MDLRKLWEHEDELVKRAEIVLRRRMRTASLIRDWRSSSGHSIAWHDWASQKGKTDRTERNLQFSMSIHRYDSAIVRQLSIRRYEHLR